MDDLIDLSESLEINYVAGGILTVRDRDMSCNAMIAAFRIGMAALCDK